MIAIQRFLVSRGLLARPGRLLISPRPAPELVGAPHQGWEECEDSQLAHAQRVRPEEGLQRRQVDRGETWEVVDPEVVDRETVQPLLAGRVRVLFGLAGIERYLKVKRVSNASSATAG